MIVLSLAETLTIFGSMGKIVKIESFEKNIINYMIVWGGMWTFPNNIFEGKMLNALELFVKS